MAIQSTSFFTENRQEIDQHTITNASGTSVSLISFGATMTHLITADRDGNLDDILLGYDNIETYVDANTYYFGSIVGRVANRINQGKFTLNGKSYQLTQNENKHHLHGGDHEALSKVNWQTQSTTENSVTFSHHSPDGSEGYPGNLDISCTFTLDEQNRLEIILTAISDKDTILNCTNHAYWNLQGSGSVLEHHLQLHADQYVQVNDQGIPTGETPDCAGTALAFQTSRPLGSQLTETPNFVSRRGLDHSFVLKQNQRPVAVYHSPTNGRTLSVETNQPSLHLYSGNWLDNIKAKNNTTYHPYHGVCFECQHHIDAINHPSFPSPVLKKNKTYKSIISYTFSVQ